MDPALRAPGGVACHPLVTRPPITPQTTHLRHVVVADTPATRPLDDPRHPSSTIRNVQVKYCLFARQAGASPPGDRATAPYRGLGTKVPMRTYPKVPPESPASPLFLVVGRETGVRLVTAGAATRARQGANERAEGGRRAPRRGWRRAPRRASRSTTEGWPGTSYGPGPPLGLCPASPPQRLSLRSASAHASFVRFGPAPPPAACSIGGTSGSADFSSPRKLNFFSSPSPSVSTTTM